MDKEQAFQDIKYIREIMATSSRYTNLSGIASIISGLAALLGCAISYWVLKENNLSPEEIRLFEHTFASYPLAITWLLVFIISVLVNTYFIARNAKKIQQPAISSLSKLILFALSPSLIVGCFLTFFFAKQGKTDWIPIVWMIFYGLGVWSAGMFSVQEVRRLGAAFIFTGMLTLLFFLPHVLLLLAISFGGYHIIYGISLIRRYGS